MIATTLLAGLAISQAQTPAASYTGVVPVAEPERLALTPRLDGELSEEEWDLLAKTGDAEVYFQWEPGKLHFAGQIPSGKAAVLSLDLRGNGWLNGRDNLEIRIERQDGEPAIRARVLDGGNINGPRWVEAPGFAAASAITAAGNEDGTKWTVESTLEDPGLGILPNEPSKIGVRVDVVPADEAAPESFVPRAMTRASLVWHRIDGLPPTMKWKPEGVLQRVTPGESFRVRYTFSGGEGQVFEKAQMRSEGLARQGTNLVEQPFPAFDNKKRAFVDYSTRVAQNVPVGYRVVRGTLTSEDGATALGQVCYRVAPVLDIELVREPLEKKEAAQKHKMAVYLRSNTPSRLDGVFHIVPPRGFKVLSGSGKIFAIYGKSTTRRVFEIVAPEGAYGTYPLSLRADMGGKTIERTAYLTFS